MGQLAVERGKADILVKRLCDSLLENISALELESLNAEQTAMRFVVHLTDRELDGVRISVAKAAARDYIASGNREELDVNFSYEDGDDYNEFLLLVTKKEAVEGDK